MQLTHELAFRRWIKAKLGVDLAPPGANFSAFDLHPFTIHVRTGQWHHRTWWCQAVERKRLHYDFDKVPVVAMRKGINFKWTFLIPADLLESVSFGYLLAEEDVFICLANGLLGQHNDSFKKSNSDFKIKKQPG